MKYPGYRNGGDGIRQNGETIILHDLERRIQGTSPFLSGA
jgi:hypothetical protein